VNQLNSNPNAGIAPSIIGTDWTGADLSKLRLIRIDNDLLSQRAFARMVEGDFPGRTYQGVYHQVRYVDQLIRIDSAPVTAVEIG